MEARMHILTNKKPIALALTVVLSMTFLHMPLPAARERWVATVVVTMTDGSMVKGELLTVKNDSLLIFDRDAGQGKNIDLRQVAQVKLFKKGKFLPWLAIGVGVGLAIGFFQYSQYEKSEKGGMSELTIAAQTPVTSLCGGILGAFAGIHEKFSLAGASSRIAQKNLERLKRHARERDDEKLAAPNLATNRQRDPRLHLRLLWMPWSQCSLGNIDFRAAKGTFRFVNVAPAEDMSVYSFNPDANSGLQASHFRIGHLRLEYEWTPHFSSSLEFIASGKLDSSMRNVLSFYSTDHARQLQSVQPINNVYSYFSLLLGLNWKPFSPSFVSKNIVELGIAAGPAQAQMNPDNQYSYNLNPLQKFKALTWMAKVHFAYDHYFNENVSLGGFIEFQNLSAPFSSVKYVENLEFGPKGIYDPENQIMRRTEITIPDRETQFGGWAYGLRVGLRF